MEGCSALATSHKIIHEMIKSRVVNVKPDSDNSQIHHLTINDKNLLNRLISKIDEMKKQIQSHNLAVKMANDQKILKDREIRTMLYFVQLLIQTKIFLIASAVALNSESLKAPNTLYFEIVKLLALLSETNKLVSTNLQSDIKSLESRMKLNKSVEREAYNLFKKNNKIFFCLTSDADSLVDDLNLGL